MWALKVSALCLALLYVSGLAMAGDFSGSWRSIYDFGTIKEVMTANLKQDGDKLQGTFSVIREPSGEKYGGLIIGKIRGGLAESYYLSAEDRDGKDHLLQITYAEGKLVDSNTIKGTYSYIDSDGVSLSGDYEATRI